jgi:Cdc6-like AAA superfamily ATPase
MSTTLIENQIRTFLSNKEPEVICISGPWGVGKTFAWNRNVKDAHASKHIALDAYSYVSLFGINSLDELKYSIFENSVKSSDIGVELSLDALQPVTAAAAK